MAPALALAGTKSLGFLAKIPWWVWLALAAVVGLFLFARSQRKKGEEKALADLEKPQALPNAGSGIPTVGTDSEGNAISWDPQPLALKLYEVMKGKDWWVWGDQEYEKRGALGALAALTDDQIVAVWNAYNRLPQVMENAADWGNLYNWMQDDSWYGDENYAKIIAAFERLGLKPKNL